MNKEPVTYKQTDRRWSKHPYQVPGEKATIGGSGCGPTCAAMLIETLTGQTFTPVDACRWSLDHGYKALNQGTYYSYFKPQFAAFGIDCERLNGANVYGKPEAPVHDEALDLLKEGYYIIACMGKGLWTSSGHYVVVWWKDDVMYIQDPASDKPNRLKGDPTIFREQVKYYWAVDARAYNEEDNMTQEKFDAMLEDWLARQAEKPASDWATKKLNLAEAVGITDGKRPQSFATRQEVALMVLAATED